MQTLEIIMVDLTTLTIAEASRLMVGKELSPVELTQAALQRISTLNPRLNAFITVLEDRASAAAKAAEQEMMSGQRRGPLHGIPIALKDLCATKGVRTTAGSKILRDHIPSDDATVALRLAEAGTILLGKLHMNEFAYGPDGDNGHYGRVRNPWNLEHIPGAQAVGSGAALAASLCLGLWAAIPVAPFAFPLHYVVLPASNRHTGASAVTASSHSVGPSITPDRWPRRSRMLPCSCKPWRAMMPRIPLAPTGRCPIMPQHSVAMCVACVLASHANIFLTWSIPSKVLYAMPSRY